MSKGLTAISDSDLLVLAALLERGAAQAPSLAWLQAGGLGHLAGPLAPFLSLDLQSLGAVVRAVLAERVHRRPPKLTLVWTGDDPGIGHSRHTRVMLPELFANARDHVLIAGYSFDHASAMFNSLYSAMVERNVTVELFVDIRQLIERLRGAAKAQGLDWGFLAAPLNSAVTPEGRGTAAVDLFFRCMWRFPERQPTVYFDPRTANSVNVVSLHAKCVVIDHALALITSANFTDRGQTRNLEAGVLIEDRAFASTLERQWGNLVQAGVVVPAQRS